MPTTYLHYLLDKACAMRRPVSGTMELTGRCNFDCKMCFIHQAAADGIVIKKELPAPFWCGLADQLRDAGVLTMLLTGGEPMLHPEFEEIYLYLKRSGFLISMNTNLSLLTEKRLSMLADNKPFILNVSLYGGSAGTYDRVCGRPRAFETVKRNLLALKDAGIHVKLNYTVTELNFEDREAVYAFARENGFPVQQTTYMFPPVRSADGKGCGFERSSPERTAQMLFECERCRSGEEFAAYLKTRKQALADSADDDCGENRMSCRAGVSSFWITYEGLLQICGMMDAPRFSLTELTFAEAWKRAQEERRGIVLPRGCLTCADREFCEVCAAICHAEGGFDTPPEYVCRKAKEYRRLAEGVLAEEKA